VEGNLVVREELDDLPDYRFYKPPEATPAGMPTYAGAEGMIPNPSDYEEMMGAMGGPGMRRPPAKASTRGAKGSSAAASKSMIPGMPPGMMPPGMMPGSSSGSTVDELDGGSRRKPTRRPRGSSGS